MGTPSWVASATAAGTGRRADVPVEGSQRERRDVGDRVLEPGPDERQQRPPEGDPYLFGRGSEDERAGDDRQRSSATSHPRR
jgi:hypothetical protein